MILIIWVTPYVDMRRLHAAKYPSPRINNALSPMRGAAYHNAVGSTREANVPLLTRTVLLVILLMTITFGEYTHQRL